MNLIHCKVRDVLPTGHLPSPSQFLLTALCLPAFELRVIG
jgi:hypothetical protein